MPSLQLVKYNFKRSFLLICEKQFSLILQCKSSPPPSSYFIWPKINTLIIGLRTIVFWFLIAKTFFLSLLFIVDLVTVTAYYRQLLSAAAATYSKAVAALASSLL